MIYFVAMEQPNLLYTILSISAVVITTVIVYVGYYLVQTLKKVDSTMEVVEGTAQDIDTVRNGIKTGILTLTSNFIDSLQKGGETDSG